jgi:hypothetical protein
VLIAAEDAGGRIDKRAIKIEEERAARSNRHAQTLAAGHCSVQQWSRTET